MGLRFLGLSILCTCVIFALYLTLMFGVELSDVSPPRYSKPPANSKDSIEALGFLFGFTGFVSALGGSLAYAILFRFPQNLKLLAFGILVSGALFSVSLLSHDRMTWADVDLLKVLLSLFSGIFIVAFISLSILFSVHFAKVMLKQTRKDCLRTRYYRKQGLSFLQSHLKSAKLNSMFVQRRGERWRSGAWRKSKLN